MICTLSLWTSARSRAITRQHRGYRNGFTVLELLIVVAVMGVVVVVGLPSLMTNLRRAKLEGPLRQAMTLMSLARFEAVKKGISTGVEADLADDQILTFRDMDENGSFNAGDEILNLLTLPKGLHFWHPEDANPEGVTTLLETSNTIFDSTGAASTVGSFFVGDTRGNHLTIEIANAATARLVIKKWELNTNPAVWWQEGELDSEAPPWRWY